MDLNDSASEAAFRAEARAFLETHAAARPIDIHVDGADEEAGLRQSHAWQEILAEHRWAAITWPEQYGGRGLGPIEQIIWNQELSRAGFGLSTFVVGIGMAGPTIIAHGTEEQKQRYLPPMLEGKEIWCQLFSEPGAGSDLAGLAARAVRDGDDWGITGQKTWSSGAHYCQYGILIARSDPSLPKHQGITYFLCDMNSPGIEIRPLRQISGVAHFSEVFLNEVRIPDANRLGPEGQGWSVTQTTLMNERMALGGFEGSFRFDELVELAKAHPERVDDVTRDELVRVYERAKALELLNARVMTKLGRGQAPLAESSVMKLALSRLLSSGADLGMNLIGSDALQRRGEWQHQFLFAPSMHIAGGTDEIQKNVAAQRVLGLPREPRADKDVPFESLRRN